ncbi:MAG: recombinase RecT [Hydrogenophaga sp.]|nr:recombinase RecT [Hydrogenophaga sp.]
MSNQLEVVTGWVLGCRDTFTSFKPAPEINFDREAGFAIQLLQASKYLTDTAYANSQSLVDAVTNIAAIGISLNPAKKQAYLVPRKVGGRVQIILDISYRGMADLAVGGGSLQWVQAKVVRLSDSYEPQGYDRPPEHKYEAFAPEEQRGPIVGVYVVAKTEHGDYLTHEMTIADVHSIRARSESFKAYLSDKSKKTPWVTDEGEMIKKGLALSTPIPTPGGWTTMGELSVGDVVFDKDGLPTQVTDVSEVKCIPCFKVTFSGGESIICDDEHRWLAKAGGSDLCKKPYSVKTVNELLTAKEAGLSVVIPVQGELKTPLADLPIDPYLLGYWLGNGTTGRSSVTCHIDDVDHIKQAVEAAGYKVGAVRRDSRSKACSIGITDGFLMDLRSAGLLENKHVPAAYLRASTHQRLALLRGLVDSDGHIDKARGRTHFKSTLKSLADAVYELACSLGESPNMNSRTQKGYGVEALSHAVVWKSSVVCATLPRKVTQIRPRKLAKYRSIKSIERIETVPTRCIAVESDSKTYLAGRWMAITHNTAVKQASKLWPRCDALNKAINYMDTTAGEGIQLSDNQPAGPQEPAGLPEYSEEDFAKNLPAWRKVIESGRRTPEDVIATVASRAQLSADQIRRINNLKPIEMEKAA